MADPISVAKPTWYEDPLYKKSQEQLFTYGSDILSGNVPANLKGISGLMTGDIPEYYKGIGETGGADFQNMLNLVKKNTMQSVNENLIRRGVGRGGIGASVTGKSIADATSQLGWQDYQRAMQGKQALLGLGVQGTEFMSSLGTDVLGGTRAGALDITNLRNQFGLAGANLDYNVAAKNAEIQAQNESLAQLEKARQSALWQSILSSSIGALGTIGGAYFSRDEDEDKKSSSSSKSGSQISWTV